MEIQEERLKAQLYFEGEVERAYEDDFGTHVLADGIVYTAIKKGLPLTMFVAKKFTRARTDFREGIAYPTLSDIRKNPPASREVKAYMAKEGYRLTVANAFLVDTIFMKVIVDFFLKVFKPEVPSRAFYNPQKAVEWLKEFR